MFVPGKLFQNSLMFEGNDGAYPREEHLKVASLRVGFGLILEHKTRLEKLARDKLTKIRKLRTKKLYNIGPRTQCYKTLRSYFTKVRSRLECLSLGKPFQHSLSLSKAGAYPSKAPDRVCSGLTRKHEDLTRGYYEHL